MPRQPAGPATVVNDDVAHAGNNRSSDSPMRVHTKESIHD